MGDIAVSLRIPTVRERILLHLLDFAKTAESYDVPLEVTQSGVARATWINIHHVGQYVRPLIGEGLVRERSAHVHGGERKRKVYEITDAGRLKGYSLREALKGQTVLVQGAGGLTEATLEEVVKSGGGRISVLDAIRQFFHTGSVDLTARERAKEERTVRFFADAPTLTDFVGRETELDAITGEGTVPRVFVVRGVPGIGKSYLAARACELLSGTHHLFWHRVRSWDTPQSVLVGLAAFLSALGRPSLRAALREGGGETSLRILRQDLANLRAILVLDDVHEASGDVLNFLRFLKDTIAVTPELRLLALARRTLGFYDRRDVVLQGLVREIDLGGLDQENIKTFLGGRVPEEFPEVGGHPLLLKLLRTAPAGAGKSVLGRDAVRFIEETIYAELSEPLRGIMKVASLYRVAVPPDALLWEPSLSRSHLDHLLDRSLITVTREGGLEVHDAVREFFGTILTEVERRDLGRFAAGHLFTIGRNRQEAGDLSASMKCLFNALEIVPPSPDSGRIAESLGDIQEKIGDFRAGLATFQRALSVAENPSDRARVHRKMAMIHISQGELRKASEELERGFRLLAPGGDGERAWLHLARSRVAVRLEDWEEGLEDSRAALEFFEASGDPVGRGQALVLFAHAEMHRPGGDPERAQEPLEKALALAATVRDPRFDLTVHTELAWLYADRLGNTEKAEVHLDAVEALLDPAEKSYASASFLVARGFIRLWNRGDFPAAEADFKRSIDVSERLQSAATKAYAEFGLSLSRYYQQLFGEARTSLERLAGTFTSLGALPSAIDAISAAAECCLMEGDIAGFQRLVEPLIERVPARGTEARPIETKSVVALLHFVKGDRRAACALLEEALAQEVTASPAATWDPHIIYSVVCRAIGRSKDADDHLDAAVKLLKRYGRQADLDFLPKRQKLLQQALEKVPA